MAKKIKTSLKFCPECKINLKFDSCECDEGEMFIQDLIEYVYSKDDSAAQVLKKITTLGFETVYGIIHYNMTLMKLIFPTSDCPIKDRVYEYVSTLSIKPTQGEIAQKMGCGRTTAQKAIRHYFGSIRRVKIDTMNEQDREYLTESLDTYREWEAKKTYPMPNNIVMIATLLKRHNLI
ncbi:hypothetical protein N9878_02500 [bacterium]|nr:hypothetical protein [bacterium]